MKHSKTKTSLYRRAYVTWLISTGINTVPTIIEVTGMPRRTVQDTLTAITEISVVLENDGGTFKVIDWGLINKTWVQINLQHVIDVLNS
ncbi:MULTISPECIES: helix-turn-helix domain-containing protein [unclassified Pseudoalteromonas]|jgi:hypothetical protein|uniref:helix-turn-helix domain-containing protein n=1 Tax=unclassified Pseudoalteromonas TaxID=194690 RepID=UPI00235A2505|nr:MULTISPECIES: helix-turn-helix domain-containing protein [unclassified Pseudoalteromonas]MCP4056492.1 helix-turn-helix domain-containing protein [Pseudoalteromonas sp.]MDC9502897.1 helix-turn-helix domain-containing protein [Pseudoalteromonas sp. Angola-18]MDC9530328.1 helix-turn-helix domain-containing protein [Pseudoalteromonas sp. Angola-7]